MEEEEKIKAHCAADILTIGINLRLRRKVADMPGRGVGLLGILKRKVLLSVCGLDLWVVADHWNSADVF